MTLLDPSIPRVQSPALPRVIRLAWVSVRAGGDASGSIERQELILNVELLSSDRAIIEIWIENDQDRRSLRGAAVIQIVARRERGFLHLDAVQEPGLLSLSVQDEQGEARVIYARTSMLASSGFSTGGCGAAALRVWDMVETAAQTA